MSYWRWKIAGILVMVAFGVILLAGISPVYAATDVGSLTITTDTTWTAEGSPYIINNLTINSGVTLTLEPGAILKFRMYSGLRVNGTLIINGTASSQVYITSNKDDSVGGDTDGVQQTPGGYDWDGIDISSGGQFTCNYGYLAYGCKRVTYPYTNYLQGGVRIANGGTATITDSEFKGYYMGIDNSGQLLVERTKFNDFGIASTGTVTVKDSTFIEAKVSVSGHATLDNSKLSYSQNALECLGGDIFIRNCEIRSSTSYGKGLKGYGNLTIVNNQFVGNYYPISFTDYTKINLVQFQDNIFQGNKYDGYMIESLGSQPMIELKPMDKVYLTENLTIAQGQEVHILAGTTIKFMYVSAAVTNNGKLYIDGTQSSPVSLTSIKDDSVGGNTDGVQEAPGGYDWGGISVTGTGQLICSYGYFAYGCKRVIYPYTEYLQGGLRVEEGGTVNIVDSEFKGRYMGIANAGQLLVERTKFNDFGMTSTGTVTVKNSTFTEAKVSVSGQATIENSKLSNSQTALECLGGDITIGNCEIRSNIQSPWGIGLKGYGNLTVNNNQFIGNYYPISFADYSKVNLVRFEGNVFQGNKYDGYMIESLGSQSIINLRPMDKVYLAYKISIVQNQEVHLSSGTVLKFVDGGIINNNGKLYVEGTQSNPVFLTSVKDDSVGGDTDGIQQTPGERDWNGIDVSGAGQLISSFGNFAYGCKYDSTHCTYSFNGIRVSSSGYALIKDGVIKGTYMGIDNAGEITVERTRFEGLGVTSTGKAFITDCNFVLAKVSVSGQATIENSKLSNSQTALECLGGEITIGNCEIRSNVQSLWGIGLKGYGNLTVYNNQFIGNYYPISFTDYSKVKLVRFEGNVFQGNKYDGYMIESLGGQSVIDLRPMDKVYLAYKFSIAQNQEVHLSSGTIVKFVDGGSISNNGKLYVDGTQSYPVYLTSVKDDSVGGDTDSIQQTPGERDWNGIDVSSTGQLISKYGYFSYGCKYLERPYITYEQGGIRIANGGIATITDSEIKGNLMGIENSGTLLVERTTFKSGQNGLKNNSGYAMVKNCLFNQNAYGVYIVGGQTDVLSSSFIQNTNGVYLQTTGLLPYIRNCNFKGNQIAVKNNLTSQLDCTWNYWNHDGGPSTYQATTKTWTTLGDRIEGNILYDPWFTTERSGEIQPARISVTGITEGQKINQDPTITVTVQDGTIKSVLMDGEPWENGQALSEGVHTFRVLAENFKQEERETAIHFSLDKTPPVAVIDNGPIIRWSVAGGAIKFTASGSTDNSTIAKYEWSFSNGNNYSVSSVNQSFAEAGEYNVSLIVTDDHGNVSQPVEAKIIIENAVLITINGVENGQKANSDLQVSVLVEAGTLNEVKLDQTIMSETSFTVNTEGVHTLTVTAVSSSGAATVKTINFSLDKTPPIARIGSDRTVYLNELSTISGGLSSDNLGIAEYEWTLSGDSNKYQGVLFQKTFATAGDYQLSLRVRDTHGFWSEPATIAVHVIYRSVEITFDNLINGQKFNRPTTIQVNAKYGTIKSIKLNDSTVANGAVVKDDGQYNVEVMAANENGEEKIFTVQFSIDQTAPTALIDRSIILEAFNDNKPITFYAGPCTDNTGISFYEWVFSDSNQIYTGTNVTRGFTQAGNYTVSLTAIDGYGNRSAVDSLQFIVKEKGDTRIEFVGVANNGRYNTAVSVQTNVIGGTIKRILCDGIEVQGSTITVNTDGNHGIQAEAVNEQGYRLVETIQFAIDKTSPVAQGGPDRTIIEGEQLNLTGSGSDINEISECKWIITGDNQTYYGMSFVRNDLVIGDYQVSLWVKDIFGNWSNQPDIVIVHVVSHPVAIQVTGIKQFEHTNKPVTIQVTAQYGTIESLMLNGQTFHSGDTVSAEGRYTLEINVLNQAQESNKQTVIFTIDKTAPIAEAGPDRQCFNDGEPLTFDGRYSMDSNAVAKFEWTFSGDNAKLSGPVVYKGFTEPGTYTVSLIVTDMAGNVSTADTCRITVMDKGNTQIILSGVEDKGRYNQDISLHAEVTEGSLQSITVDKTIYTESNVTITSDGYHTIIVKAINDQGYTLTKRWTVSIDKTPPVPDAGGDRKAFINQPIRFSGGFSQDNSGVGEYRWEFSDGQIITGKEIERTFSEVGDVQVSLWVKDNYGNWSIEANQVMVRVLDPGTLATVNIRVTDEQNIILPNAIVVIEDAQGVQTRTITDSFGESKELLEAGSYKLYAYHAGFKTDTRSIMVEQSALVNESFKLERGSDIVTVTESRQLDLNEIKALGIDTSLPENRFIFKFQLQLEYMEFPVEAISSFEKKEINLEEGNDNGFFEGTMSFPDPRVMVIIIQGTASVLKEFHEMSIVIINGADGSVSLDDTQVLLNLPKGLSLAPIPEEHQTLTGDTILKQSLLVDAGSIPGQTQKKISWVLRGDEPGSYSPTINYSGVLNPFAIEIKDTATLNDPISISDPKQLELRAAFPDIVYGNEPFSVKFEFMNRSEKPVYDAYLKIDSVETKYVKMLSKLDDLFIQKDCLMPGEKLTISVDFLPEFSGILSVCDLKQIGGNVEFSTKILPDCPRLFTQIQTDDRKVSMEWLANPGSMTYFRIYRRKAGEEEFKVVCSECYDNFYDDTQVENFVTYEYVITAIDLTGEESEPSKVISATPGKITTNLPQGSYAQPFSVSLNAGNPNSVIYYTVDGSKPVVGESIVYTGPIYIGTSTTIKAIAVTGDSISNVFEFLYFVQNSISGEFIKGSWEKNGSDQAVHANTGNEYGIQLDGASVYDWSGTNLPPSYIRTMPDGNWTVESLVSLESFIDGTGFAAGLILTNGTETFAWGYQGGTNLAVTLPGATPTLKATNGSTHVYLRLRRESDTIYFEYRVNSDEEWHLAGSRTLQGNLKAGVYARTWGTPHPLQTKFTRFTLVALPSLDTVWEWQRPAMGPEYHALSNQSATLIVPATRTFNQGTSADWTPKIIRKDLGSENWRFSATLNLEETPSALTYFTGLAVHFGGYDWLHWGREGQTLIVRRIGKGVLFTLAEAPAGPIELQIQRSGYRYTFLYRPVGTTTWIALGNTDITTPAQAAGVMTRTWTQPQRIVSTFSQMKLEKILAKLGQDWSWQQGTVGTTCRVLASDGIAIAVKNTTTFDDSSASHKVSRLQREAGLSDWQMEVKVTPGTATGSYLAGLQVLFGERDILTWGLNASGSLQLERAGELIQEVPGLTGAVYLRARRTGNQYVFEYRLNTTDPWTEGRTIAVPINPLRVGVAVKTLTPTTTETSFTGLKFSRLLPASWEWVLPTSGPTYTVQNDNSVQIIIPNDKAYPYSATADLAPQLRTDLAARGLSGDWDLTTTATLEEYTAGNAFKSGLMIRFDTGGVLQWGFQNGLNLRGALNGTVFTSLIPVGKTTELRIRKVGTVFYLEYRPDANSPWQSAGQKTVETAPVYAGVMTNTNARYRVTSRFTLPELTRTIPEYTVTFTLRNQGGISVSRAVIRLDQGGQHPVGTAYTTSLTEGAHLVTVTAPGYKTYQANMNITGNGPVEIIMEPETTTPNAGINSVTPEIDPITGQLSVGVNFTNLGTDTKFWVRVSLVDDQNRTIAILGGEFTAATGETIQLDPENYIFKLPDHLVLIKVEILSVNENGPVLAIGETPVL